jgi:hypothetical protein
LNEILTFKGVWENRPESLYNNSPKTSCANHASPLFTNINTPRSITRYWRNISSIKIKNKNSREIVKPEEKNNYSKIFHLPSLEKIKWLL